MTEVRSQMTEDRSQMTEDRSRRTTDQRVRAEGSELPSVFCYLYSVIWTLKPTYD
jgi:hypothetical protein